MQAHTERFTFRPGQVPADPAAFRRSQEILDAGEAARDLFVGADNTAADRDGHEGIVVLRDVVASGLLEPVTTTVSGKLDRSGELKVVGENRPGQPPTVLVMNGDGILVDRPAYVNHHLLPSLEGVRVEEDGTRFVSFEYYEG